MQTTVGMMQTGDWEEGGAVGIMKYDDGTLWYWNGEMTHTAYDYWPWWVVINEYVPGAKAWEQIMPDYWSDVTYGEWGADEGYLQTGDTGELIDGTLLADHWLVAHDGGDKSYWFSIIGDANVRTADLTVYIISKEARTWELKILLDDDANQSLHGQPVIWSGYVWYVTKASVWDSGLGAYVGNGRLYRMEMESPYTAVLIQAFPVDYPAGYLLDINPDTGLPVYFDSPFIGSGDPAIGVDDDGFMYFMNESGYATGLWRLQLPNGGWEVLYYDYNVDRYNGTEGDAGIHSYNLPGRKVNDRWHGPLPIGISFRPNWWYSKIGIRDGWMYWVNDTAAMAMLSSGWTGGHTWCRMRLSDLKDGPVRHQPEDPIFEVISMTTGGEESYYNWDDTTYWGGVYKSWGGFGWRDGIDSIHAFVENMWFFDDDGSIVYVHHEYPDFYMEPGSYNPPYILSRLSPPQSLPITFNLVFEGEEMKGYGHVREVPAKTRIGTIELSGE